MTAVVDTSILIDVLRQRPEARAVLRKERDAGHTLHASEITRLEILVGMRPHEERVTRSLLELFVWHPVDGRIAEIAGEEGRRWRASQQGIDAADLAIAASALHLGTRVLTRNVRHLPMFPGLVPPY